MALDLTSLAPATYGIVALLAAAMAVLGYRSYAHTGNVRLLFVVVAFVTIVLKSLVVVVNELMGADHPIDHHTEVVLMGVFDVIIVLLFFMPFLTPPRKA